MTPPGRGAVASILLSGDIRILDADLVTGRLACFQAARGRSAGELPLRQIVFGWWGTGDIREEIVLCRLDRERTEIHCHGGQAAVQRVMHELQERGCRIESWQDHVARTASTLAAECLFALIQSTTTRTAELLLTQQQGGLEQVLMSLLDDDLATLHAGLDALLAWGDLGVHLSRPWSVVLCGRPNVGKSSLLNALVGYGRSIVFEEPGTTRDVVSVETALDGWPIRFEDTAGLRESDDALELQGIERASQRMLQADLLLIVLDGSQVLTADDHDFVARHPEALVVVSKCDLPAAWEPEQELTWFDQGTGSHLAREGAKPRWCRVSSLSREGLDNLQQMVVARLIPDVPPPGTLMPVTPRQVECLRSARTAGDAETARQWIRECLAGSGLFLERTASGTENEVDPRRRFPNKGTR